jgi:hypothetical protein
VPLRARAFLLLACLSAIGCAGDDLFAPTDAPDLRFIIRGITASDIASGRIDKSANVSLEPGDPWGDFLAQARSACGGDPESFDVTLAAIGLDITTSSVESLDEVFTDDAGIYLRPGSTTAGQVLIAEGRVQGSGGEFVFMVPGDLSSRLATLQSQLLAGNMHVAVSGATARTPSESFSLDVRVRLRATASCGQGSPGP